MARRLLKLIYSLYVTIVHTSFSSKIVADKQALRLDA